MPVQHRAVFFDRDGVLNKVILKNNKPFPPANVNELKIFPDANYGLTQLADQGYFLFGVTNQPDVARGTTTRAIVDEINQSILEQLPLKDIRVCFHDDIDNCVCRKPKPGLLLQLAKEFDIDLTQSFMIGDRWKDIEAGKAAGCKTIWLKTDYDEKKAFNMDFTANSLTKAVAWISSLT
jgi:D-glycero-D-manno-heptose 1,7-bisphosphate phosphatase